MCYHGQVWPPQEVCKWHANLNWTKAFLSLCLHHLSMKVQGWLQDWDPFPSFTWSLASCIAVSPEPQNLKGQNCRVEGITNVAVKDLFRLMNTWQQNPGICKGVKLLLQRALYWSRLPTNSRKQQSAYNRDYNFALFAQNYCNTSRTFLKCYPV